MEQKYKNILSKATVLLVDDDADLRSIFKKTIESYVDFVFEASNGVEALDLCKSKKPHIVITDIKMPVMDGLMFATILRQIDSKTSIVAVSAYSEPKVLIDLIPLNLTEYLVKPIDFTQLTLALEKCAREIEQKGYIEIQLSANAIYSYSKKHLFVDDNIVALSPNEISFLELLIENENKLITKSQIEDTVYNNAQVTDSAINTLTSKLRKKIGKNIINAISSHGYLMVRKV